MSRDSSNSGTSPSLTEARSGRAITRARFEPSRGLRASDAVRDAVAAAERCDPQSLRPSLAAAVDTDAVDSLLSSGSPEAYLSFRYAGYTVEVYGDGRVRVR